MSTMEYTFWRCMDRVTDAMLGFSIAGAIYQVSMFVYERLAWPPR